MSELYKRIEDLCQESGVTVTAMCKESGVSRASLTDLKMGRKQRLSADTLSKIAKYFQVSVDYLLGNTSAASEAGKNPEDSSLWGISDAQIQFALFGGNDEITEAMYEEVKKFAAFIKQREGYGK